MRSFGIGAGAALLAAWAMGSSDTGDAAQEDSAFRASHYGRAGAFSFTGEGVATAWQEGKLRLSRERRGESFLGFFSRGGAGGEGIGDP